jgi:hypothetical protein
MNNPDMPRYLVTCILAMILAVLGGMASTVYGWPDHWVWLGTASVCVVVFLLMRLLYR